jgi:hypothetical protein
VGEHVIAMLHGPGTARFVVQPVIALLLGLLHGARDHRQGHSPFLKALFGGHDRRERLGGALRSIALPLTVALVSSVAFQYVVRSRIRFGYAVLYAFLAVAVPYFLARAAAYRLSPGPTPRRLA